MSKLEYLRHNAFWIMLAVIFILAACQEKIVEILNGLGIFPQIDAPTLGIYFLSGLFVLLVVGGVVTFLMVMACQVVDWIKDRQK